MKRFRKISAILLSILVLLCSTSFTFSMHFCMGQLESIVLFSTAEPCEMATKKSTCASEKHDPDCDHEINKNGCCEDHTLIIEGREDLKVVSKVTLPDFQVAAFVIYTLVSYLFLEPTTDYSSYKDYSPPLIERDIPVLVQSFLI